MKAFIATIVGIVFGLAAETATANPPLIIRHRNVEFVPYAQYVYPQSLPAYSVGTQLDPALLERIAVALEKIASRGQGGGELADLPPEPEYVGLVRANCAKCHGITPQGNKLSFFDAGGRFKEPDGKLLGQMLGAVSSGSMPKGSKMQDADRLKLISGLVAGPPEAAAKMPEGK